MDLVELRTKLRTKVGNPSIAEAPELALTSLINEAYEEIHEKYTFHKARRIVLFPTVAGSALYDIPSDALSIFSLWNTTTNYQRKIVKRDENWLSQQQTQQTGPPVAYVRQRAWLELSPVPDAIYTLRLMYKCAYDPLVVDADVPVIPFSWHPGIWRLARFLYWDEKGDLAKAQWSNNVWLQWVSDKPNELQEEYLMDDTEGVSMPSLMRSSSESSAHSQTLWDRE